MLCLDTSLKKLDPDMVMCIPSQTSTALQKKLEATVPCKSSQVLAVSRCKKKTFEK